MAKTTKIEVTSEDKRKSLFDLGVEGAEIERILWENEGELTPELEAQMDKFLKAGKEKMDLAARVVRNMTAEITGLDTEIARLQARKDTVTNKQKSLKGRMLFCLKNGFSGSLQTGTNTFWVGKANPATKIELVPDADLSQLAKVVPTLIKTTYAPDNAAIKLHFETTGKSPTGFLVEKLNPTEFLGMR